MPTEVVTKTPTSFFRRILTKRHFLTRRTILLGSCLVVFAGLIGVSLAMNAAVDRLQPTAADRPPATDVRALEVEVLPLRAGQPRAFTQIYSGTVQPRRTSILASKFAGRVESVAVDTGSLVAPQQVLAQLDQTQIRARIDAAKASLEMAKAQLAELENGPRQQDIAAAESKVVEAQANLRLREAVFERIKTLYASQSVSLQELDEATFQLDAIRAQLNAAQQDLHKLNEGSRTEQILASRAQVANIAAEIRVLESDLDDRQIVSPYAGQIQARFVDEGTIVSPGQQILQIVEGPPYEIRVGLPLGVADCLANDKFTVSQNGLPLDATIVRVAPAANEATQTRQVVLELSEDSSRRVSLGSAITIAVEHRDKSTGFWVPTSSLTAGSRGLWALMIAKTESESATELAVVERRQVELLRGGEHWSEVQGPISAGELVIASGTHRVTPNQQVKCVDWNHAETAPSTSPLR